MMAGLKSGLTAEAALSSAHSTLNIPTKPGPGSSRTQMQQKKLISFFPQAGRTQSALSFPSLAFARLLGTHKIA